jgi:excinuclease ABC subunit C
MVLDGKLERVPARPGVYLFKSREGAILYVGKGRVLRDRVRSYFQASRNPDPRRTSMVAEIADLELVLTDTEMEALALENNLIKRHKPRYNVLLRDDKNHPYLKLTLAEEYPRLYVVRRPGEDGNAYGGPYIPASMGRKTASLVHKLFGVRSCKETLNGRRPRPCLQHQIGRCIAPCVAEICSLERYRRACEDARLFLEGRTEEVVRRLAAERDRAAGEERYEEAASLRDQVRTLERLDTPQKITTTDLEERDLFGACREGERAALQVFSVRDGKVVAREGFLVDRLTEPESFLASSIQQYYAQGRYVPREILAQEEPPDRALLESWLSSRRGSSVRTTSSGSSRAGSPRRSCAPCASCSSWRWIRTGSSASTSPTSRGRTSWRPWSASRTACRRSRSTGSSG